MDVVEKLHRWQRAGGGIELIERSAGVYLVTLTSCDSGAAMEQITVTEPELARFHAAAPPG